MNELRQAQVYLALLVVFQVLTTLVPLVRFWVLRGRRRTGLSLTSDIFFATSAILSIGFGWQIVNKAIEEIQVTREYSGQPLIILFELVTVTYMKFELANSVLFLTMIYTVKAAFLCFYWGLFKSVQNARRWGLWATAFALPAAYVAVHAVYLTDCRPLSRNWDLNKLLVSGQLCSPTWDLRPQIIATILNVVTDLMLLALPLTILGALDLTRLERRVLPIIFAIGMISISAPLIRFFVLQHKGAYDVAKGSQRFNMDRLHWVEFLSVLEVFAAQAAFCMPSFRAMLQTGPCASMRSTLSKLSKSFDQSTTVAAGGVYRHSRSQTPSGLHVLGEEEAARIWVVDGVGRGQNRLQAVEEAARMWADTPEDEHAPLSPGFIRIRHDIELAERGSLRGPGTEAVRIWS